MKMDGLTWGQSHNLAIEVHNVGEESLFEFYFSFYECNSNGHALFLRIHTFPQLNTDDTKYEKHKEAQQQHITQHG